MIWHSSDKDSVLRFFSVDKEKGLEKEMAEAIFESTQLEKEKDVNFYKILLEQFNNYLTLFMFIAAILLVLVSVLSSANTWISAIIIVLLMFIDNCWNAYQEYTSEKAMVDVEKLTAATANVLRSGEISRIPAEKLIPGDIIVLGTGDYIPADCRLIETNALRCDEYSLTGETVFVDKDCDFIGEDITEISKRNNMIFAGCTIMAGNCKAVVTETGIATEMGKMNTLSATSKDNLAKCSKSVINVHKISTFTAVSVCILYFIVSILLGINSSRTPNFALLVSESFTNSVALAVSSIPSILPAVITIILGQGIKRLWGKSILIRKPESFENIANVSIICADKTGCLTSDEMNVVKVFDGNEIYNLDDETPLSTQALTLLKLGMICGNGLDYSENSSKMIEDSTDIAIAETCQRVTNISSSDAINIYPLLGSIPFDNDRKIITTINMINGKPFVISKGAPESLIDKCVGVNKEKIANINYTLASEALRVIAVAYKAIDEVPAIPMADDLECGLTFVGLICLYDTPGEDVVTTVEKAEKNGIRTVMLTGDNLATAKAVARRIGIFHDGMKAITGEELSKMSDEELEKDIISYSVFARVSPDDRYRIVRAFQHNNETVAIMGSKIDDAPILNKADVGISVDINSTDVARRASDIVVDNNRLTTVIDIINYSKTLFTNIKNIVHYLLSGNLALILILLVGMLIFASPVLTAAQLLLINLITDALPSMAIGTAEHKIKRSSHTIKTNRLFSNRSLISLGIQSFALCVISLIAYKVGYNDGGTINANTVALIVLGLSKIVHALSCYSQRFVFATNFVKNTSLLISLGASITLLLIITLTPINTLFGISNISFALWIKALLLVLIFFIVDELIKLGFIIYDKFKKR